ncbi:hypothetical protein BJ741DRAFT_627882 [Chytriomyces cf. hyalinus JEL632]|nr:hypothetical protein BJ741DRAFT_627882 [Chytriomyces cf. hyalinus JEL632]
MLLGSISTSMPLLLPILSPPTLPLDAYQGIFQNPVHGTITLFEAGTTLHFDMVSTTNDDDNQDLHGIIGPWHANTFAVFEVPLLGYKDYESPVMMFEFFLSPDGCRVDGFRAFLGDDVTVMVFERKV